MRENTVLQKTMFQRNSEWVPEVVNVTEIWHAIARGCFEQFSVVLTILLLLQIYRLRKQNNWFWCWRKNFSFPKNKGHQVHLFPFHNVSRPCAPVFQDPTFIPSHFHQRAEIDGVISSNSSKARHCNLSHSAIQFRYLKDWRNCDDCQAWLTQLEQQNFPQ